MGLLPAILAGIIAIVLLYNSEKEEEFAGRLWSLIFGILFVMATIFLTKLAIEYSSKFNKNEVQETEYFYDYY